MRILMLTPDSQMIDRRILQEAAALKRLGHEVILLAGFECPENSDASQDGIEIHRFAYDWDDERLKTLRARVGRFESLHRIVNRVFMTFVRRFLELTSFERFIVECALPFRADVVHCHDLPVLRAGVRLAKLWNVPCVFDAHELYHQQETFPAVLRERLLRDEKELLPRCDAVITVNEFIAAELARIHGVPMPWVLYNSCEAPPIDTVRNRCGSLRDRLPAGTDGPIVLFQGWLSAERNIDNLVRAVAYTPSNVQLAVIGYGEHESQLRKTAAEAEVTDRVHFLGRIPAEELPLLHGASGPRLIPYLPIDLNHHLCSPNKFFEFVLSGVPVLAHRLPFFEAMAARHGVVECTDMDSPEAIGQTISSLIGSGRLEELRAQCLAARDRLGWHNDANRLGRSMPV